MADPLGLVYNKRDNSGAAIFLQGTPDFIGRYAALAARNKPKEKPDKDLDFDMREMGDVWDADREELTKDFLEYRNARKAYEQEKDPVKKAAIETDIVKRKVDLATNINKSRTQKKEYTTAAYAIDKDQKMLYPENAQELLDSWRDAGIKGRSQNPDIHIPSTIDFGKEFASRMKVALGKPNQAQTDIKVGDEIIKKGSFYYDQDEIQQAAKAVVAEMPGNVVRSEKMRMMQRASQGDKAALAAISAEQNDPESTNTYLSQLGLAYVEPSLQYRTYKRQPAPAGKGSGSGSSAKPKFEVDTKRQTFFKQGTKDIDSEYAVVSSKPIGKSEYYQEWVVPTSLMQSINRKYKLGIDELEKTNPATTPTVSIKGTFQTAQEHLTNGQRTVTIVPYSYAGKYLSSQNPITINLEDNETTVNSLLNGEDVIDLIQKEKAKPRSTGITKRKEAVPPGSKLSTGINWAPAPKQ